MYHLMGRSSVDLSAQSSADALVGLSVQPWAFCLDFLLGLWWGPCSDLPSVLITEIYVHVFKNNAQKRKTFGWFTRWLCCRIGRRNSRGILRWLAGRRSRGIVRRECCWNWRRRSSWQCWYSRRVLGGAESWRRSDIEMDQRRHRSRLVLVVCDSKVPPSIISPAEQAVIRRHCTMGPHSKTACGRKNARIEIFAEVNIRKLVTRHVCADGREATATESPIAAIAVTLQ